MSEAALSVKEHMVYPEPPKAKGIPFIGNYIALLTYTLKFLRRSHEQYGDVFAVSALHHKFVVLAGPQANRFAAREGADLMTSAGFWGPALTEMDSVHSFIGVDGKPHQYQRKLLTPYFAKAKFTSNTSLFTQIFQETIASHYGKVSLVAQFFRHILAQQIGVTMHGYRPTSDEVEALITWENTALQVCSLKKYPWFMLILPPYRTAKRKMKDLARRMIDTRDSHGKSSAYLKCVIEKGHKANPQWFTPGDIDAHAIMPFIAGSDTIGAELCFALLELLKQPDLCRRLRDEVDTVFTDAPPTVDMVDSLVDVKNFCTEVLRLYPTVYALRRMAESDFVFNGYQIKKGQHLILFVTSGHTKDTFYSDPLKFDIDRHRGSAPSSNAFTPFGVGAHLCPGAKLTDLLLPLNLALLLRCADVAPVGDLKSVKVNSFSTPGLTLSKNFSVRFTPRK
jgi:cytochrome P450